MTTVTSQVRRNYHPDCEAAINRQVNMELHASYVYLSMAYYFDRGDGALRQSHEERLHAEKLLQLQNQRGGRILLHDINNPEHDWESGLKAMECAFHLEKSVNQALLELHQLASEKNDAHLCDFLEHHYLHDQVRSMQELGDYVTYLSRLGAPEDDMARAPLQQAHPGRLDIPKRNRKAAEGFKQGIVLGCIEECRREDWRQGNKLRGMAGYK